MRARALAVHALARSRGAGPRRLGCSRPLGGSAAKWTNVVWPIKSRPTDKQINTHYSFIGIDILEDPSQSVVVEDIPLLHLVLIDVSSVCLCRMLGP